MISQVAWQQAMMRTGLADTANPAVQSIADPAPTSDQARFSHLTRPPSRHIVIVAWRDLANPKAGGSEVLVDRLANGMLARGHAVTLLCGGQNTARPYRVVRSGGDYTQFLAAPFAYRRRVRDCDVVVEVCNGLPYLTPLWCRRPAVCLVNHVHTDLWSLRYPPPLSTIGRFAERVLMPWAHNDSMFLTVSGSSADELAGIGVQRDRIRLLCNGLTDPPAPTPRSGTPLFLALGRLAEYKRLDVLLRLWERVRPITGGRLVIAGDGPDRARVERLAGADVTFTGHVSEEEKHRLLCSAWLLLHPALIEGWGIVVTEAAIRGTPTIGFDVPGLRDSVIDGETGLLARTEGQFASAWASMALNHSRRVAMGEAGRRFAVSLRWSAAVDRFAEVVEEAIARHRTTPPRITT
jgi:glycosyltransferase involved in cell wall biosynthesis